MKFEAEKDIPVFARDVKKAEGRTTGGTRRCRLAGCCGIRIGVRWPDGHITWPCSRGMGRTKKGWRIL